MRTIRIKLGKRTSYKPSKRTKKKMNKRYPDVRKEKQKSDWQKFVERHKETQRKIERTKCPNCSYYNPEWSIPRKANRKTPCESCGYKLTKEQRSKLNGTNEKKSVTFQQTGKGKSRDNYSDELIHRQKESEIRDRVKNSHTIHYKDIMELEFDYGECANCGAFWYDEEQKICARCGVDLDES